MLPACPGCGLRLHLWLTTRTLYCGACEYTATANTVPGYVA